MPIISTILLIFTRIFSSLLPTKPMSVLSQVVSEAYPVGNNSTTTPYVITMERDLDEDLKLEVDGVVTTAFTVSGAEFRTNPAIPATSSLRLYRDTPKTQLQTFPSNTTPAAEDVRAALDKMTMIVQEDTGRVSPYSVGSTFVGTDTVGVGDFGKQCLVVASGDTDITLTDGTEQGQRLAFFVSNS